jgi:hypothetical protein
MKFEMSGTALLLGLMLWGGGIITWIVATVFDHMWRYSHFQRKRAEIQGACNQDPGFASTVGNIDVYLADHGEPRPSFSHCLFFTACQPLLIIAIIAIPTFRPWDFDAWVASVVNAFAMVCILVLTCFHEYQGKVEFIQKKWYRFLIVALWIVSLVMILWIAHISEDSPAKQTSHDEASATKAIPKQMKDDQPDSSEATP